MKMINDIKLVGLLFGFFLLGCSTYVPANAADIPLFTKYPRIDTKHWYISNGWANSSIQSCEWRSDAISTKDNNLLIVLSNHGGKVRPYGCGEMHTNQLSGFGTYETRMRSAAGSGLNTAFFTFIGPGTGSSVHDEIDFEFLGKDPKTVQLNYYVNGKSSDGTIIKLGFDASKEFHNYSFAWSPTKISWFVDGKLVHETKAKAVMPTHPGRIYLSLWSGSKEINQWLGPFNYQAPATAEYSWVKFTPSN